MVDQGAYKEMLAAIAASQTAPTAGPQPRRQKIYLVDDRPEINGRPMDVNRSDAREWIQQGLAKAEPFSAAAAGPLVTAPEYRPPEDPRLPALVFNPNTNRYEAAPAAPSSASASPQVDIGRLVAAEVKRRLAAMESAAPASEPTSDDAELDELRAAWAEANPGKKYPPAAKSAWFRKQLAE